MEKKIRRARISLGSIVVTLALFGCASGEKKAEIPPNANPNDEVAQLETQLNQERADQANILSEDNFNKAESYLDKAKKGLASGDKQSKILDDVAIGMGYANHAQVDATNRRPKIEGALTARAAAEKAGAATMPETKNDMASFDSEINSHADRLDQWKPKDVADVEKGYLDLESKAIRIHNLGNAKAMITGAKDRNAAKYAPNALHKAELDYATADGAIRGDLHAPDAFKKQVDQANLSAQMLTWTLSATKDGKVDEATAANLVAQDRQIAAMKTDLSNKDRTANGMESTISKQGDELRKEGKAISLQESLEKARNEFSPDEAEVFQQGQKLFIRLKDLKFASGRSELPAAALPILAKVRDVASQLSPQEVLVEGNTDSVGSKQLNMKLSQKRADAVAKYLRDNGLAGTDVSSIGYGYQHPLTDNKTADGRATNRRVDVLITPHYE